MHSRRWRDQDMNGWYAREELVAADRQDGWQRHLPKPGAPTPVAALAAAATAHSTLEGAE